MVPVLAAAFFNDPTPNWNFIVVHNIIEYLSVIGFNRICTIVDASQSVNTRPIRSSWVKWGYVTRWHWSMLASVNNRLFGIHWASYQPGHSRVPIRTFVHFLCKSKIKLITQALCTMIYYAMQVVVIILTLLICAKQSDSLAITDCDEDR